MEDIMKEKGVLKLVHPGRFVEIHTQPITAAEVLRKNPRHCIARPDVFRNPWLVVRPEAVLRPERVFFIVPIRTIYRLLKASEDCKRSAPLPQFDSPEAIHGIDWCHQISPLRACAGMTPKPQNPQQIIHHQFQTMPRNVVKSPWDQDTDKNLRQSLVKQPWGKVFARRQHSYEELELEPLLGSVGETTIYHDSNASLPNH